MKKCPNCRTVLEDDEIFCHECGAKQEVEEVAQTEETKVEPEGKKCIHCGETIEADSMFCPFCGKPQEEKKQEEEAQNEPINEGPAQEEPKEEKPTSQEVEPEVTQEELTYEEEKSSKKWLWILLTLLVVGAGGWYFYSNSGWSDDKVAQMETIDTDSIPMPVETEAEALPEQTEFRVSSITYDKSSKEINTQLSIDYPETDNIVLKENILKFIVESLTNDYTWGERPRPTYEGSIQDGNAILEFFANEKIKEISEEWERDSIEGARAWEEFISVKLIFQSTKTISYTVCFGGCHGGVADGKYYGVTFNKENGNIINVIKDPSDENLKRMLISQLETGDTEGLLFREEYMAHPFPQKSPYIYNDSVRFVYQKYEIAPGACGPVEVSIPVPEVIPYMSEEAISAVSE